MNLDRTWIQCHARQFNVLLWNELLLRRSYRIILGTKTSFKISGAILLLTFNISVTRARIFLWWIENELSFLSRPWNEDHLFIYRILFLTICGAKIIDIHIYNVISWEKHMAFAIIDFHEVKVKPLKKKLGKKLGFFYY